MNIEADVLIVGTGIAGLFCALHLREDIKIVLLTKTTLEECNTYLAQGGISTILNESDKACFIEDTMKAGMYKNDLSAVTLLANEAQENIETLQQMGVKFDTKGELLDYTAEGGHRVNRIVHCTDQTGKKVLEVLLEKVKEKKNITFYEKAILVDIVVEADVCTGGIARIDQETFTIHAKKIVLATGGIGGLFKKSTNQRVVEGVGTAIAIRNHIKIKDTDCIQYHPTALYDANNPEKYFLITESLRGEGAKLINIFGDRFVDELLPRNHVAKAILDQQKATRTEYQYLDISFKDPEYVKSRFPSIYQECMERGIDITKELIPITPVQHYVMGGIEVNSDSETSMPHLYACGECSCTGVHGANRMASNSLLEALVYSRRAALKINRSIDAVEISQSKITMDDETSLKLNHENIEIILEHIKQVRGDLTNELVNN